MRYLLSEQSAAILRALGAGRGGVTFAERRIAPPGALSAGCQWKITAAAVEDGEGAVTVSVGPGLVAWGAGVNFANPGGAVGTLEPGQSARVVWATEAPPIPLVHDPRWPEGNAPQCPAEGCDCPQREGDPFGDGGDAGTLLLVDEDWTAPEGTTDVREIGAVSVSGAGGVSIRQHQRDTIVARAIVGRGVPAGDEPDLVDPTCGNPLNSEGSDDTNPLDLQSRGSAYGSAGGAGDNPLDNEGKGGYTPSCKDAAEAAAAA